MATARSPRPSGTTSIPSAIAGMVKSGYERTKIYREYKNSHDHYTQMNFKYSPTMDSLMEQAVASNPGYDSKQDVVRDALFHHIVWMANNPGSNIDAKLLDMEVKRLSLEAFRQFTDELKSHLKAFSEVLELCEEAEDWSMMNAYIEDLQDTLDREDLNYSPAHREWIQDAIDEGMKAMADAKPKRKRTR